MKNILLIISTIALMALSACANTNPMADMNTHMGCQEDEIKNGECVPAQNNTAELFKKDLSSTVQTEEISDTVTGFIARPKAEGTYPGVVMIHEWWGLNDNIKYMAQLLANEGYNVLAIDLYDGKVADTSANAGQYASAVRNNPDEAVKKMKAAAQLLKTKYGSNKMASLGWCFGGQQSLNLALNDKLDATVIYYGQLTDNKEELKNINWPVLGIFGDQDQSITVESVKKFETALNDLGVNNDITIYKGVGHAFANPSGSNYATDETKDAWAKTLEFLNNTLKKSNTQSSTPVVTKATEPTKVATPTKVPVATKAPTPTKAPETAATPTPEAPKPISFTISGKNFAFLMNGSEAPTLTVKKGQTVTINFNSEDGFHDWVVDEFNAKTDRVQTGGKTSVTFTPDKTGEFEYYCSVGQHRANGMKGKLIVE